MQEQMGSCQHKNLEETGDPALTAAVRIGGAAITRAQRGVQEGRELTCSRTACMAVYGFLSAAALPMPASWTKVSPTVKLPC